jgi:hypothetical protein
MVSPAEMEALLEGTGRHAAGRQEAAARAGLAIIERAD